MNRRFVVSAWILFLVMVGGCSKAERDQNAIRAALQKHLSERGTLNMAAMEMDVKKVTLDGDRAQAQVEFRLRQGGGGMQIAYSLERQGRTWVVLRGQPTGGEIAHPPLDQTAPEMPWDFPRLSEFDKAAAPSGRDTLPAAHPAVGEPGAVPRKIAPTTPGQTQ